MFVALFNSKKTFVGKGTHRGAWHGQQDSQVNEHHWREISRDGGQHSRQNKRVETKVSIFLRKLDSFITKLFYRLSASEVRAENAERAATRLQGEADTLQSGLLQEKQRGKRMEEDMQGLVTSLENI